MKAFVLQMNSTPKVDDNLDFVREELANQLEELTGALVVLPECFAYFGGRELSNIELAETLDDGPIQTQLADIAREFSIYLVAGTLPIKGEEDERARPMTLVFNPNGERITSYQKIHLFDVDVADGVGQYRESDSWQPGDELVLFDWQGVKVGLAICYDLRFAGMFSLLAQQGAEVVVLPSAFTKTTGKAHWQVLLQARAIENQVFMLGCDQSGTHQNGRETFGHSMIVDPWGKVLVNAEQELGLFGTELDLENLLAIRQGMPVLKHNKIKHQLVK